MHPDKDVDPPRSSSSAWFLALLGIIGIVLLIVFLRRGPRQPEGVEHPSRGASLESVTVEPLLNAEQPIALSELDGKVTLINFWGPWCPPCLRELPELLKLEKEYRGRDDVRFLLVSYSNDQDETTEELRDNTLGVLSRHRADPAIYHDPDAELLQEVMKSAKMEGFGFPTTIVIDGQRKVRAVWTGYDPSYVGEMGKTIEQVLSDKSS